MSSHPPKPSTLVVFSDMNTEAPPSLRSGHDRLVEDCLPVDGEREHDGCFLPFEESRCMGSSRAPFERLGGSSSAKGRSLWLAGRGPAARTLHAIEPIS